MHGHHGAIGAYGERVAARHLVATGMEILDRNWRGTRGELDLVLRDGPDLVVCEVKTRSCTSHGSPLEAVDATRLDRLVRLGLEWAEGHGVDPDRLRVDVVGVLRAPRGAARVEHLRGVG